MTTTQQSDEIAEKISTQIHSELSKLKGPWLHDPSTFLPANVECDYAGQRMFINLMNKIIATEIAELVKDRQRLTHLGKDLLY